MLILETLHIRDDGTYPILSHHMRFRLTYQDGDVINTMDKPQGDACELFVIRPLHLPEVQQDDE